MPDPDAVFRAGLARLLAARYGEGVQSPHVARDGDVLCRLLTGWLDTLEVGERGAVTVYAGPGGAVHLYGLPDPNDTD